MTTVDDAEKPDPVKVNGKLEAPAMTVAGLIDVSVGAGLTIGRLTKFETKPGLRTYKDGVPVE